MLPLLMLNWWLDPRPKEYTVKQIVDFVNTTIRKPDATTRVPVALGR